MSESCSVMSDSLRTHSLYSPWNSPVQNTGLGSLSFLQGIFPTQGSNPGLPQFRRTLYQLTGDVLKHWLSHSVDPSPDSRATPCWPTVGASASLSFLTGKQTNKKQQLKVSTDREGGCRFVMVGDIWEISVVSIQFAVRLKLL